MRQEQPVSPQQQPTNLPAQPAEQPQPLGVKGRTILGLYMIALPILLGYLVLALWPKEIASPSQVGAPSAAGTPAAAGGPEATPGGGQGASGATQAGLAAGDQVISLFGFDFAGSRELRLILLVMVVGALGSYIHSATSFADYVGNRRLSRSWVWYYILRTFVGMSVALLFYFVIRGGLLSAGAGSEAVSVFGIAAVSGLVGLFSRQATDKLREVFDTLFKTEDQRGDQLTLPRPEIVSINPETVDAGSQERSLTVNGNGFVNESVVRLNGANRPTNFVSATQLTAELSADDLRIARDVQITVFNPAPGGGLSSAKPLKITQP